MNLELAPKFFNPLRIPVSIPIRDLMNLELR